MRFSANGNSIGTLTIRLFEPGTTNAYATYMRAFVTCAIFGTSAAGVVETMGFKFSESRSQVTVGGTTYQTGWDTVRQRVCTF